ncbi:Prohormone convertase 1 [Strongyloides ratti]|uniref:Prohormone convertase 1 n=1 Tax=Strongyloides ratti TaxID=34506 RepID=A0A090L731_STRRB|nr:Prohormone convertase 1 [Strongyloides ratti]CEF65591.1 Prohormone convertase 1 [Strongyloides ratti]
MKGFNDIFVLKEKNNMAYNINKNYNRLKRKINLIKELEKNSNIEWIEIQKNYKRYKKELISIFNYTLNNSTNDIENKFYQNKSFIPMFIDPLWKNQWQIHQYDEERKNESIQLFYDMQIIEAWEMGYSGKGIVISILDDGIDYNHEDLRQNYESRASYDFNDDDNDPLPRMDDFNKHGTKCAGIIAMVANNTKCGVGVAFNSKVGGIRMLDGEVNDRVEAEAITYANQIIDIFAASWGPNDDGRTVEGPGYLTQLALKSAVYNGRGKKGSILVWASGNGGIHSDNCNCDGYAASIYTISVSGVTQNNNSPWYGEECSSTLVSAYSSGSKTENLISTTDLNNKCATDHSGTSASVPTVAGIIALTLEANNSLTWRDIQHIIVWTAEPSGLIKSSPEGWQKNGAGLLINSRFGFGLINAKRMVTLANNWTHIPVMVTCSIVFPKFEKRWLTSSKSLNIKFYVDGCKGMKNEVKYIEQVQLLVEAKNRYRGNLAIWLESPKGTKTQLLHPRHLDDSTNGFKNWPFTSVQTWGENPNGEWKVHIVDLETEGFVSNLTFVIHGTKEMPKYRENEKQYNLPNIENYINQKNSKDKLIDKVDLLKYGKRFVQSITENGVDIDDFSSIEQIIALHEELKKYKISKKNQQKIYIEGIET